MKENDLLYQIDPRPFQAALDQAQGQVERLEAAKKLMAIQVNRYAKLAKKGAASQQDVDEYTAQQAENIARLKTAQAQVETAKLNLGFTRIAAPVTGKISRTLLTPGNLVNADDTVLTTMMSIDPMYAYFNIEEPTVLRIQKMVRQGAASAPATGRGADQWGWPTTSTTGSRCTARWISSTTPLIRRPARSRSAACSRTSSTPAMPPLLTAGLFVRVRLTLGCPHQVLLVTERAIGTDQGEKFVYVLDNGQQGRLSPA